MKIRTLLNRYRNGDLTPRTMVDEVLAGIESHEGGATWIYTLDRERLYAYADRLTEKSPEDLPLYGIPFAIKDNIDLAGCPTTAGCPDFSYLPEKSAFVVEKLMAAGAIPIGKTNMDQFATGLVGTRTPYGIPRNPYGYHYIPGGSSSGSAVAVAAGEVSFALGTDTAGSGRVPAAFNNLYGVKPSRGLLSTSGIVPACRSLDCVSLFTLDAADATAVLAATEGYDPADPWSRKRRERHGAMHPHHFVFGVPRPEHLRFFGNSEYRQLFAAAVARLESMGGNRKEIDFTPFAETARLLYEGPWIAERSSALADFFEERPESFLPITYEIIAKGKETTGTEAFGGLYRLRQLKRETEHIWSGIDILVTPTAGTIYTTDEVAAEPMRLNANLGYYTNYMNLLDLAALAVPAGFTDAGLPFGITLAVPCFNDYNLLRIGEHFSMRENEQRELIAVCGAHMRGLPLNRQLTDLDGTFVREERTAACYRLFALDTVPAKPGLVRSHTKGAAIDMELWSLPLSSLGKFLSLIPHPLCMGKIEVANGTYVTGFLVEDVAVKKAREITEFGGWRVFRTKDECSPDERS